jgi:Recombination endonuclease VII
MATREYHREWRARQDEAWKSQENEKSRKYYWDNRERALERQRAWRAANKARVKHNNVINQTRRYGIEQRDKENMFIEQGFLCAICRNNDNSKRPWHVDHCHVTKKVRGILCGHCNVMLGRAKDSPETLLRAAAYLRGEKWSKFKSLLASVGLV